MQGLLAPRECRLEIETLPRSKLLREDNLFEKALSTLSDHALIEPRGQEPAIDRNRFARDEARRGRGEINRRAHQFLKLAEAVHGRPA